MSEGINIDIRVEQDGIPLLKMDERFSPDQLGMLVIAMREYIENNKVTLVERKALEKIERQSSMLDEICSGNFELLGDNDELPRM